LLYGQSQTLFPGERFPNYFFSVVEARSYVEAVTWPRFVLNNLGELMAVNATAQTLWGVDFDEERTRRTPAQLNLLAVASESRFAKRIVNWDECLATLIAVIKGRPDNPGSLENPDLYLQQVLGEFSRHDPGYLPRLFNIWISTPPSEAKAHWSYRVLWFEPGLGEMRFCALVSTINEPDALGLNDWIPMDAQTWEVLNKIQVTGRRVAASRPASAGNSRSTSKPQRPVRSGESAGHKPAEA
jgi:hypothetical protein